MEKTTERQTQTERVSSYVKTLGISREKWLEMRKKGIGSSDCAAVLGLNSYKTPLDVYLEKVEGFVKDNSGSELKLNFGLEAEPIIAKMFMDETGLKVIQDNKIRFHKTKPFMLANLDRLAIGGSEGPCIVELKTVSEAYKKNWDEEIPINYYCQIQHQLAVTGYQKAYIAMLVFGFTGIQEFKTYEIPRDEEFILMLEERLENFWNNHILAKVPPPVTNLADVKTLYPTSIKDKAIDATDEIKAKIDRINELKETLKPWEKEKKTLENDIKMYFRDSEFITYNGKILAAYKTSKDSEYFDLESFKADCPDLFQKYLKTKPGSRRLNIKKG